MRPTIETQHVDWIADCVQYLRDHGFSRIDAEEDAEDAWVQHNNEVADRHAISMRTACRCICRRKTLALGEK